MIDQICPDCCVYLKPDNKKLGEKTKWLVCPKCGHRERPNNESISNDLTNYATDRIKQRNKNLNSFNYESETDEFALT